MTHHRPATTAQPCWAGIDTHAEFHVIVITDDDGHTLSHDTFPSTDHGISDATQFIVEHHVTAVGIEGSSSYGARLTLALLGAEQQVMEVTGPQRQRRHRSGKSDLLDATSAAEAVRTQQRVRPVKNLVLLPLLRTAQIARSSAVTARTIAANELHALARILDITLPPRLARTTITTLAEHPHLGLLARRWLHLDDEPNAHTNPITAFLNAHAPALLAHPGVGPDSAARLLLTAGGNPDRITTDAAFARLAGVAPVPASSGKTQRHRLHRGGDRSANNALHTIARIRYDTGIDPRTHTYITRRLAEGKTRRDIIRCLKRYIARELLPDIHTATTRIANTT